ncbi:MAG: RES family NAD+ phosphorylase [Planctomycetes bacterium]|nr:RES family NAD+ phosphorylase [Planctomycetota bacterium]
MTPPVPGPHPDPPANLHALRLPLRRLKAGLFRFFPGGRSPLHFGRKRLFRFDDPRGRFGVLYAAEDEPCAFIETFGQALRHGFLFVTDRELLGRDLVRIRPRRPLRLVDLAGPGLVSLGADARLGAGDYRIAQKWSRAIYEHPARPDGLLYPARHDPSRIAVAIFDLAASCLASAPLGHLMLARNAALRSRILLTYRIGLLGTS